MRFDTHTLLSPDQDVTTSGVYIGYLILKKLKQVEKISIFDIYGEIEKKNDLFNYGSTMHALVFLYMNGLIDFSEPYIFKLK